MKQLTRTAVYWPNIDTEIVELCRSCTYMYPTLSISSKATMDLLEDFAHFEYPHAIVLDNAICFKL